MKKLLGFDIGGTKCAVLLGEKEGTALRLLERSEIPTSCFPQPEQMMQRLIDEASQMCRGNMPVCAGISCGGPLDSRHGRILSPPNLPGWDDVPVTDWVQKQLKIPAYLRNDADAGALAEWRYGAGQGCQNMIFITFGTGCGAGLILNGALYSGTNDMAGECGHIRLTDLGPVGYGKAGAIEGFCSGAGIAQLASLFALEAMQQGCKTGLCARCNTGEKLTAKLVAQYAAEGDPVAQKTFQVAGQYLGKALAMMIDLLNPERIVLGSVFVKCRELLWTPASRVLRDEALERSAQVCQVLPAALGSHIGDYAALCVADYGSERMRNL